MTKRNWMKKVVEDARRIYGNNYYVYALPNQKLVILIAIFTLQANFRDFCSFFGEPLHQTRKSVRIGIF